MIIHGKTSSGVVAKYMYVFESPEIIIFTRIPVAITDTPLQFEHDKVTNISNFICSKKTKERSKFILLVSTGNLLVYLNEEIATENLRMEGIVHGKASETEAAQTLASLSNGARIDAATRVGVQEELQQVDESQEELQQVDESQEELQQVDESQEELQQVDESQEELQQVDDKTVDNNLELGQHVGTSQEEGGQVEPSPKFFSIIDNELMEVDEWLRIDNKFDKQGTPKELKPDDTLWVTLKKRVGDREITEKNMLIKVKEITSQYKDDGSFLRELVYYQTNSIDQAKNYWKGPNNIPLIMDNEVQNTDFPNCYFEIMNFSGSSGKVLTYDDFAQPTKEIKHDDPRLTYRGIFVNLSFPFDVFFMNPKKITTIPEKSNGGQFVVQLVDRGRFIYGQISDVERQLLLHYNQCADNKYDACRITITGATKENVKFYIDIKSGVNKEVEVSFKFFALLGPLRGPYLTK